ncbi:MAG TPA: hypothetical protein VEZ55_11885 [Chitinophagaceae bacterium]|jgi:hypothetical protein|nr:hypothetical protein [Chitinophagaceae bacterium]
MYSLNSDPNQKKDHPEQQEQQNSDEGVYVYNDDGTPMDTGDRTYVSVDLPEEDASATGSGDE